MCGKSLKKLLVFCFVIVCVSSALFAFGWDRSKAAKPVTVDITPTVTAEPVTPIQPEASESMMIISPVEEAQPEAALLMDQPMPNGLTDSVTASLETINELLAELESSKKASKDNLATLTGLQTALASANANFQTYKDESARLLAANEELTREIDRVHLGIGFGASYTPFEDLENFGASCALSIRKNSIQLIAGAEYPDMMNVMDFDYNKIKFTGTVIWEF